MGTGLLALDLGTSFLKITVFALTSDCSPLFQTELPAAQLSRSGQIFLDQIFSATRQALTPFDRVLIALCAQGPSVFPCDKDGEILSDPISWSDGRAQEESLLLREAGRDMSPVFFLPKVLWFERHLSAELLSLRDCYFSFAEHLTFLLTGQKVIALPFPEFSQWYWSAELLQRLGKESLISHLPSFTPLKSLLPAEKEVQSRFFPKKEVYVFPGAPDFLMNLLGSGLSRPGQAAFRLGTGGGLNFMIERPARVSFPQICARHIIDPFYNLSQVFPRFGSLVDEAQGKLRLPSDFLSTLPLDFASEPLFFSPNDEAFWKSGADAAKKVQSVLEYLLALAALSLEKMEAQSAERCTEILLTGHLGIKEPVQLLACALFRRPLTIFLSEDHEAQGELALVLSTQEGLALKEASQRVASYQKQKKIALGDLPQGAQSYGQKVLKLYRRALN